jgi:hypothetical protein
VFHRSPAMKDSLVLPEIPSNHCAQRQRVLYPARVGPVRPSICPGKLPHLHIGYKAPAEPAFDLDFLSNVLFCLGDGKQEPGKGDGLPVQHEDHAGGIAQDQIGTPEGAGHAASDDLSFQANRPETHLCL